MEINKKYSDKLKNIIKACSIPNQLKASSPAKISLKSNCAFSLPPGPKYSCPGATPACKDCYAMKNRFWFDSVMKPIGENWKLVKKLEKKNMKRRLKRKLLSIIPKKAKVFRLGETGDFYSDFYLDVWNEIIKQKPRIKFWAYTRSFKLDFTSILKNRNFNLFASTDRYNKKEATEFVKKYSKCGVKHAYGPWRHSKKLPKNSIVCPAISKKIELAGACESCKLCVVKNKTKKHIVFLKH